MGGGWRVLVVCHLQSFHCKTYIHVHIHVGDFDTHFPVFTGKITSTFWLFPCVLIHPITGSSRTQTAPPHSTTPTTTTQYKAWRSAHLPCCSECQTELAGGTHLLAQHPSESLHHLTAKHMQMESHYTCMYNVLHV